MRAGSLSRDPNRGLLTAAVVSADLRIGWRAAATGFSSEGSAGVGDVVLEETVAFRSSVFMLVGGASMFVSARSSDAGSALAIVARPDATCGARCAIGVRSSEGIGAEICAGGGASVSGSGASTGDSA
ncbi:MAG: hypothetical protein U0527_11190 [Candidatus Eisenbacteria bacterium]